MAFECLVCPLVSSSRATATMLLRVPTGSLPVPSSSLGAGTNNDRLVDDIFTTRLLKNIEQSLKDLEEGNNRNAKSVLKTFLEVMV